MSTIEETMIAHLTDNGMFDDQAAEVLSAFKATVSGDSMKDRWAEPMDGYPPMMRNVLTKAINHQAVLWIDDNLPEAWCRPQFAGG